ncbi:MAG TPA: hypothetical protein VG146_20205, partial [Verrucomicrobiae bacterium]|nr:hypothetical protein [Verrucomicrobiae bacterium]
MNALLAKEIRLLLPAWGAALLLAVAPVWLLEFDPHNAMLALGPFCIGTILLGLSSFGREVALNTFPLMLAQPSERARIWWTKVGVLAVALAVVSGAWWIVCATSLYAGSKHAHGLIEFFGSAVTAAAGV